MSTAGVGSFRAGPVELPHTFPVDVFWSRVDKSGPCWVWTGATSAGGYGRFQHRRTSLFAHRVSWLLHRGSIEPSLQMDHLCRNRRCVNPDHLEQVTGRVNTLRGEGPTARNAIKTHCDNGHLLAAENLYMEGGRRVCRPCRRKTRSRYEKRLAGKRVDRRRESRTHCNYGHGYTPENTRIYKGRRVCRACDRRRAAEYSTRQQAVVRGEAR